MGIEIVTTEIPAATKKEALHEAGDLAQGTKIKAEIGEQELDTTVPRGKVAKNLVLSIRWDEEDA